MLSTNMKSQMLDEAMLRLKLLESEFSLNRLVRQQFLHSNGKKIYYSDRNELHTLPKEYMDTIRTFEEKHNAVVYLAILTPTRPNDVLSCFYVSQYKDEWPDEKTMLHNGFAYVYHINLSGGGAEIGNIWFKNYRTGLIRTQ